MKKIILILLLFARQTSVSAFNSTLIGETLNYNTYVSKVYISFDSCDLVYPKDTLEIEFFYSNNCKKIIRIEEPTLKMCIFDTILYNDNYIQLCVGASVKLTQSMDYPRVIRDECFQKLEDILDVVENPTPILVVEEDGFNLTYRTRNTPSDIYRTNLGFYLHGAFLKDTSFDTKETFFNDLLVYYKPTFRGTYSCRIEVNRGIQSNSHICDFVLDPPLPKVDLNIDEVNIETFFGKTMDVEIYIDGKLSSSFTCAPSWSMGIREIGEDNIRFVVTDVLGGKQDVTFKIPKTAGYNELEAKKQECEVQFFDPCGRKLDLDKDNMPFNKVILYVYPSKKSSQRKLTFSSY